MEVRPYLFFEGRAEEAAEFYRTKLGAKVEALMRFKDAPEPDGSEPAGCTASPPADKVMHMCLKIGETSVMGSDGMCQGKPSFQGFSLTLDARDEAEADRLFNALADGGKVQMPLAKTFFSPRFGMVADRFGVGWMVIVQPEQS
ncbi:MAG: VOC family protein [Kiloniellales bacterium]